MWSVAVLALAEDSSGGYFEWTYMTRTVGVPSGILFIAFRTAASTSARFGSKVNRFFSQTIASVFYKNIVSDVAANEAEHAPE